MYLYKKRKSFLGRPVFKYSLVMRKLHFNWFKFWFNILILNRILYSTTVKIRINYFDPNYFTSQLNIKMCNKVPF